MRCGREAGVTMPTEDDLELRQFEAEAERRYRTMTGMDETPEHQAQVARRHAENTPLSHRG